MSEKPDIITLPESKKEFISLGDYMDNNDGIIAYYPNSHSFDDWKSFFLSESPVIQIFALEHFSGMDIGTLSIYGDSITDIITKNKSLISNFFSKNYGWPYDERFEDSIWYHGSDEFESECIELINEEGQDLQDQLFVIKEHHNTFVNELSVVLKVLFEKKMNMV
jgi:hypothetical protein